MLSYTNAVNANAVNTNAIYLIFYLELCQDKDDICQYEPSCEFDRIKTECPKWCKLCSEGALHFMEYNYSIRKN